MESKKEILNHIKLVKVDTPNQAFFESLSKKVVDENPKTKFNRSIGHKLVKMTLAAAAVLIIALVLFKDFSDPAVPQKAEENLFSKINDEEIYAYVDQHIDEFTLEEITAVLSAEEVDNENAMEVDVYFTDISQEEIMDYIENENIDLDEFEDELLIF